MARAQLVYGYRITGRGADGVIITLENTASVSPEVLVVYEEMWNSLNLVAEALEQFAAEAGHYPADVGADYTPLGNTLTDFLPGGDLLMNPIMGIAMNPADSDPTGTPGLIGYTPLTASRVRYFSWDQYSLQMAGPGAGIVFSFMPFSDEDTPTRFLMLDVQRAVKEFKTAASRYPMNVDVDETPAGDTVLDLLSGIISGSPNLVNSYTGAPAPPINGLARRSDVPAISPRPCDPQPY